VTGPVSAAPTAAIARPKPDGRDIVGGSAYISSMSPSRWTASDLPDPRGRSVIVTGANSGIGRVAALELARAGAAVTLADLGSVRSFADATEGPVDVLVDNAGVMATPSSAPPTGSRCRSGPTTSATSP
jgi:hypothetical protein